MTHHLVGVSEIATMLGVSRQRVHQIIKEDAGFPAPTVVLTGGSVWERVAVERWAEQTGRSVSD